MLNLWDDKYEHEWDLQVTYLHIILHIIKYYLNKLYILIN